MRRSLVLATALFALGAPLSPASAAKKPKLIPCNGRWVIRSGGDALVADSTPAPATVAVQGSQISLGNHCTLRKGSVHVTAKATKLAGRWPSCAPSFRSVALSASISSDCTTMTGTFRAKKLKPQKFQATKSACRDGVVDGGNGEQCDGGGCAGGLVCTNDCLCKAPIVTVTTSTIAPTTTTSTTTGPLTTTTTPTTTTTTTTIRYCGDTNEQCCGNGITDPENNEQCDDGNQVNGDGCETDCTLPVCGNGIRDLQETCDDGTAKNGTAGDPCPADCVIAACDPVPASARAFDVNFTPPPAKGVAGLTVLLDYPEDRVSIPGSGNDGNVVASITNKPFGASSTPNDTDWALTMTVAKGTAINPGRLFRVTFNDCSQATPPTPGDFTCVVTDASDPDGNVLAGVTCSVVAVP